MNLRPRLCLPTWLVLVALAIGLAWSGLLALNNMAGRASVLDRPEATLADMRLLAFGPRAPPAEVVIVAIDDAMVEAEGGYPIERQRLAQLLEAIRLGGATTVAIDLMFVDGPEDDGNPALAAALAALPTVLAAAGRFDRTERPGVPQTIGELRPLPIFAEAASVGLVNVATDAGGTPRHLPLVFLTADGPTPSFALRAVDLFADTAPVLEREGVRVAGAFQRLDLNWHLALHYYGPEGSIPTVGGSEILADPVAARSLLEGRLVVVGATATAVGDRFGTPFDRVLPGAEVLATGVANLLEGSGLIRDTAVRRTDAAAMLTLTTAGVLFVAMLPQVAALGLFALCTMLWLAAVIMLFGQGYWLSLVLPLAGPVPVVAGLATIREVLDRRRARAVERAEAALARLQAPALARRIAEDPGFLAEPVEQDAAIVFVDLVGFTGLSEQLGAARTESFLKAFHSRVVEETHARGGLVMSFMGDGAMVVFGVPSPRADDAARALQTAHALVADIRAWAPSTGAGTAAPDLRAGAHYGPVVLSRLGHDLHQHVTISGDSVNTASRLMDLCKEQGARVAASSDLVAAACATDALQCPADTIAEVAIRGRRQRTQVHFWQEPWLERDRKSGTSEAGPLSATSSRIPRRG